jgi:glycosyltransferase involved in cell wall biosynthesis
MPVSLSIVIPAYNEEAAIGSIVERTVSAGPILQQRVPLDFVEIIVVNDGSVDRTAEIATSFHGVTLISFPKNRGYGAAIKAGFSAARGSLVAFLDADGTCDPLFFSVLCRELLNTGADVVIGARLTPESSMPAVRRLGNRIFAALVRAWGGGPVSDTASGMRVLRKQVLPKLYPLPDGMHFTPAMSSLAIFDPNLRIKEVPMPYQERTGASKLRVFGDGVRFLRVIVQTALMYRPFRFLGLFGVLLLLVALALGIYPIGYYLSNRRIEEWMVYRLVTVLAASTCGTSLIAVGLLAQQTVSLVHADFARATRISRLAFRYVAPLSGLLVLAGVALNLNSVLEYFRTGQVTQHWIYVLTGALLVILGVQFAAFGILARILRAVQRRREFAAQAEQLP